MPRLFVAIAMPTEVVQSLERLTIGLPAMRWTEPEQFHLTLRFIGEVDHGTFCEMGEQLADISMPPFDLQLEGIGQFPLRGPPNSLWAGVAKNEHLLRLKRRIDRTLEEVGLEPERRKFTPHVTIGRFRDAPPEKRFGSWLARRALFRSKPFPVHDFGLYSSYLHRGGAEHQLEATYDFVSGVAERV
ncbi:MAG: RNA 2',3'-cyclic phosphodiesterase [Pseudomonadota bacterium]